MNHEKLGRARLEFEALKARETEAAAALKSAQGDLVSISWTLDSWRRSMPSVGRFGVRLEPADLQAVRRLPDLLDDPAEFARIVEKYQIADARGIAEQLSETHRRIKLSTKLLAEARLARERMGAWFHGVDRFAKSLGY